MPEVQLLNLSLVDGECQHDTIKSLSVRALVGITCVLSILGTLLIIISYVLFKEMRTPARQILVHLSFMDLGIALAHLTGVALAHFTDQYYQDVADHLTNHSDTAIEGFCVAQAFVANYCTMSSFLWTSFLAVYMYFRIVYFSSDKTTRGILYLSYVVCYGVPVATTMWLLLTNRLGYTWFSGGWCSLIIIDPHNNCKNDVFITLFGYDLWVYLTFILAFVLYISVHVHIHQEFTRSKMFVSSGRFWEAFHNVDYKFLFIPLAFVFLRMWSCIITIIDVYCDCPDRVNSEFRHALFYLEGMGDSGQGFVNALLFVAFTKRVREKFFCWCRYFRRSAVGRNETTHLTISEGKEELIHKNEPLNSSLSIVSSQTSNINY